MPLYPTQMTTYIFPVTRQSGWISGQPWLLFLGVLAWGGLAEAAEKAPERSQEQIPEHAIAAVQGRYIPAYMDDQGYIISLGDCGHTYIEIDQHSIHKRSGNRSAYKESFKSFELSPHDDKTNATYVFNGETEGKVDATNSLSTSLPRWRYSRYKIIYFEEENRTYLAIAQTDRFDLTDGHQETKSSYGYYLPCPPQGI